MQSASGVAPIGVALIKPAGPVYFVVQLGNAKVGARLHYVELRKEVVMPLPLVPVIAALAAGGTLVPHAAGGMIVSTAASGYVAGTYLSSAALASLVGTAGAALGVGAVSYTHLTLPTIYSV